jgi:hypothetical protein
MLSTFRRRGFSAVLGTLLVTVCALTLGSRSADAAAIHGGISFNGNVTAFLSSSGMGSEAMDFMDAHSLVFGSTVVSSSPTGTFSPITAGTSVSIYSPLIINPATLPTPSTKALWQVSFGGTTYFFTPSSLTEPVDTSNALELSGTGTFSDSISSADNTPGTWVATFTTSGCTYSWNCSSKATPVPEPGSVALLSMASVGLLARRRKLSRAC